MWLHTPPVGRRLKDYYFHQMANRLIQFKHRQNSKVTRGKGKSSQSRNRAYAKINEPIPRIIAPEIKCTDTAINSTISNTGTISTISLPSQGLAFNQRTGDRMSIRGFDFSMAYTASASDYVRIIVFQEKGLASATPTASSILQTVQIAAPVLYNAREQYHILSDELFTMVTGTTSVIRTHRTGLDVPIKDIHFQAASTTTYSGQIWMLALTNTNLSVNETGYLRVWFEDSN